MNSFSKILTKTALGLFIALFFIDSAKAQDEEAPALSISGSVDAYFRMNLNGSSNAADTLSSMAPTSSFANLPGFSTGMANIITSYSGENAGFVADLVFGPRGTDAVFASTTASSSIVNQLYAYWNVSESVTLTLGNFNTFLGYEVISPTGNYNYSTSYMFSYGPFSHSGFKADIALGEASLMLGVFNTTDDTDFNTNGTYYGGAQIGFGGAYLNFLFTDGFFQGDLTAGWDLTDAIYLGVNGTYATDNFYGGALYLQNSFSDDFSMGIRGEYFADLGVGAIATDETVIDVTLTANYSIGNLTIIPEVRLDQLSYDGFTYSDDTDALLLPTDVGPSLSSFVLAAVYAF
jgi:hypothetical protein